MFSIFSKVNFDKYSSGSSILRRLTAISAASKRRGCEEFYSSINSKLNSKCQDVDGIKYVINFDYPQSSEDYIHRIGRTGRSNTKGTSYAFFTRNNAKQSRALVDVLREANQEICPALEGMARSNRFGDGGRSRYGNNGGGSRFNGTFKKGSMGGGNRGYGGGGNSNGYGGNSGGRSYGNNDGGYGRGGANNSSNGGGNGRHTRFD